VDGGDPGVSLAPATRMNAKSNEISWGSLKNYWKQAWDKLVGSGGGRPVQPELELAVASNDLPGARRHE
jgi:hypothetical protein